ncbi:MAG: pyrroline-5-carboxylate reductase [Thermoplasmata archaeon]|nr:pyrroline-5-carboxylate reductase [Thermoplasmata archaeon]
MLAWASKMSYRIGFIGTGKMASAIIKGVVENGFCDRSEIIASNPHKASRERAENELGIKVVDSNAKVVESTDIVILSVKPQQIPEVFSSEKLTFGPSHTLVSIAAGVTIETLKNQVPDSKIFRVMPNICSTNFVGAACFSYSENCTELDIDIVKSIFESVGMCFEVKEKDVDAVSGVSGSSPAFMFMVIDAMADAGVLLGLPRDLSIRLAAQTMLGSAVTVLESGKHPDELKDMVCSPGGTTIEGVKVLEEFGLRAAFMNAIEACVDKAKELGRKG